MLAEGYSASVARKSQIGTDAEKMEAEQFPFKFEVR